MIAVGRVGVLRAGGLLRDSAGQQSLAWEFATDRTVSDVVTERGEEQVVIRPWIDERFDKRIPRTHPTSGPAPERRIVTFHWTIATG